jgi:hypothetical protein
MLKQANMKPPNIMPEAMVKPLADSKAPIIPPTTMLTSNQKIQIANVFTRGAV